MATKTKVDMEDPAIKAEVLRLARQMAAGSQAEASTSADAAYRAAMQRVKMEQARALVADEKQRQDPEVIAGRKKLKPLRAVALNTLPDPTVYTDKSGKQYVDDAEFQYRWVPKGDSWGRENGHDTRIATHENAYGYEVVTDENGEAVTSGYGVLMRITHEQKAMVTAATSPTGGVSAADYYRAKAQEIVEDTNLHHGGTYLKTIEPEHRLSKSDTLE